MKFKVKTKPWEHQLKALNYLYPRDIAALYTDMGTGKTKIMIDLMRNRDDMKRVLVVAPLKACKVWKEEIKRHGSESKFRVIYLAEIGVEKKCSLLSKELQSRKLDTSEGVTTVIIINYESVWRNPIGDRLLSTHVGIDTVICDESHRIKSPGSKCSRYLARIGKRVKNRYLVTGTPLAENPMDIYAQYRFLDPTIFGTNFGNFCAMYQNIDPIASSKVGYTVLDSKNPYKNLDDLKEKMFSVAFTIKSSVKLPKMHSKVVKFDLGTKVSALYKELLKEGILDINNGTVETEAVISRILREQQITSGFLPVEQDDGTKKIVNLSKDRAECFLSIMDRIGLEPVVVFCKFKKDIKNVQQACRKKGIPYSELSGSHDTMQAWKDGLTQVLIVQYSSGSESITLTRACHTIYYSLTHSYAQYKQSKKRIHRPTQTRECYYWHIIGKLDKGKSIDEKMIEALKSKKDIVDYIMEGLGE